LDAQRPPLDELTEAAPQDPRSRGPEARHLGISEAEPDSAGEDGSQQGLRCVSSGLGEPGRLVGIRLVDRGATMVFRSGRVGRDDVPISRVIADPLSCLRAH
jgi:hypothetical protein